MIDENFAARSLFVSVGSCAKIKLDERKKQESSPEMSNEEFFITLVLVLPEMQQPKDYIIFKQRIQEKIKISLAHNLFSSTIISSGCLGMPYRSSTGKGRTLPVL